MNKVVLAYSGGLDTSVAVAWLKEQFNVEVVTLTVDLGGGSLRKGVEARAISAGASRAYVVDARERFVTDFVWPHLQANALYQGAYPLATALARPLIAQLLVEVAKAEGADAVAHGCTGKGNDQVRFDIATHALDPGLEVVAPMRVGMGLTRDQEIDYAAERGIEIPITKASPYSIDVNLWGRSCETGVLEDPWVTPPADAYEWTVAPSDAPAPVDLVIDFEGGVPVALDGERLASVELVERVHELGGKHGVGRIDHVEDRLVGIKSREIYETPAATILHTAHRALEGLTLSRDTLRFNRFVADELARLIYDGLWFSALSRDLRAYIASSQRVVSGEVRVRLDHGSAVVVGRRSPMSLYDKSLATYDEGDAFDHASAVGLHRDLRAAAARRGGAARGRRQAPRRGLDMDGPVARGPADADHGPGGGRGLAARRGRRETGRYHGAMTDTTDLRTGLIDSLRACRDAEREIFGALDPATRDATRPRRRLVRQGPSRPPLGLAPPPGGQDGCRARGSRRPGPAVRGARRDQCDLPRGARRLDVGRGRRRRRRDPRRVHRRDRRGDRRGAPRSEGARPDPG